MTDEERKSLEARLADLEDRRSCDEKIAVAMAAEEAWRTYWLTQLANL